jgi:hypothetical protein
MECVVCLVARKASLDERLLGCRDESFHIRACLLFLLCEMVLLYFRNVVPERHVQQFRIHDSCLSSTN